MSLKVLTLSEPTVCPACHELIERTFVVPVFFKEQNRGRCIMAVCPNCGMGFNVDLDEMAKAVSHEVTNRLSVAAALSYAFM